MKRTLIALIWTFALSSWANSSGHTPHWAYVGQHGPEHWGTLDSKFSACASGKQQSPVDLRWSKAKAGETLSFKYKKSALKIIDNGHTIQINYEPGSFANIRGEKYELVQMHFHTESEHTIAGKAYPLELHFVHKNKEGKLAVVGVMMREGSNHGELARIWNHLPQTKEKEITVEGVQIDPSAFLPTKLTHYHYMGSLTTPPCSEGVNWNVLNTPVAISSEQLMKFTKMYAKNNRPIQPLHGRKPASY